MSALAVASTSVPNSTCGRAAGRSISARAGEGGRSSGHSDGRAWAGAGQISDVAGEDEGREGQGEGELQPRLSQTPPPRPVDYTPQCRGLQGRGEGGEGAGGRAGAGTLRAWTCAAKVVSREGCRKVSSSLPRGCHDHGAGEGFGRRPRQAGRAGRKRGRGNRLNETSAL